MRLATAFTSLILAHSFAEGWAADVRSVQLLKSAAYIQSSAGAPVLQPNPFEFRIRVDLSREESVSTASMRWPPPVNATRSLTNYLSYWEYSQRYPLSDSMNFANPNGTYSIFLQNASDGQRTNVLSLFGDGYPSPIQISNFPATQTVNSQADFTLQWNSPGTAPNDLIQVRISSDDGTVFETGGIPGAQGALTGSARSVVIPRNTLNEGSVYRVQVIAARRSSSDAAGYPGVPAIAMYARRTEFVLRTIYSTLDVNWFGVAKLKRFTQASPLPPVADTPGAYQFSAFATATDAPNLKDASLKLPNGSVKNLSASGLNWTWSEAFTTQPQLDAAYAPGNYELNLQTAHNGSQKLSLSLTASPFPAAVQIGNWSEASAFDPAKPFTLKWLALAGGTSDDFLQVTVTKAGKNVFRTPDRPLADGALDGRASSVTIPAGLLLPGESAEVTLIFLKALAADHSSYPQALGTVCIGCETRTTIRAQTGQPTPPVLGAPTWSDGMFQFNVTCTEGRQQVIQTSSDFRNWTDLFSTNPPSGLYLLRLPADPARHVVGIRVLAN